PQAQHGEVSPFPSPRERSEWRGGVRGGGAPLAPRKRYAWRSQIRSKRSSPTPPFPAFPAPSTLPPHRRVRRTPTNRGTIAAAVGEQAADDHEQLRIGEAGHRAVGAAMQLLRQIEPAVAGENADAPPRRAVAGAPHLAELAQARPVLVLEHDEVLMRVDQI